MFLLLRRSPVSWQSMVRSCTSFIYQFVYRNPWSRNRMQGLNNHRRKSMIMSSGHLQKRKMKEIWWGNSADHEECLTNLPNIGACSIERTWVSHVKVATFKWLLSTRIYEICFLVETSANLADQLSGYSSNLATMSSMKCFSNKEVIYKSRRVKIKIIVKYKHVKISARIQQWNPCRTTAEK